jgi:MinD-like ATPase involved in chromosome partitioning or flagellar assembly
MPRTMSFVSFKGGSGRSVGLSNVGFQLALSGARVGCVDFDIEGGGLHTIYGVGDNDKESIQHFLMDEEDLRVYMDHEEVPDYRDESVFLDRLVVDVQLQTTGGWKARGLGKGALFLIQAKPDARATGLVDTGANLFFRFNRLLESFGTVCKLDYILIDCRSGISNLALPGLAYADMTVVFLRWGSQHRYGTERLLAWYSEWLERGEMQKDIYLVASTIDPREVSEDEITGFVRETLGGVPIGLSVLPVIPVLRTRDVVLWDEEEKDGRDAYSRFKDDLVGRLTGEEVVNR